MKVAIFTRITARKPTILIVGVIATNMVIYTYRGQCEKEDGYEARKNC